MFVYANGLAFPREERIPVRIKVAAYGKENSVGEE